MKVLNLYAGIGGNRKLWKDVEVTAVEINPDIAKIYQDFFPDDKVIVSDAHRYLLEHFQEYDFIWSSPPCPSHSQFRFYIGVKAKGFNALYPDMKLYEEIILLKHHFKGKWAIENTRLYYEPLIKPSVILQRHYIWSNYKINNKNFESKKISTRNKINDYDYLGFDLSDKKIKDKRKILRNCVDSELGLHVFNESKIELQPELFKNNS